MDVDVDIIEESVLTSATPIPEDTPERPSISMTPSPVTPSPLELTKEDESRKGPHLLEVEVEAQISTLSPDTEKSHETPMRTPEPDHEPEPPKIRRTMADYAQRRKKQKEEEAAKAS